MIAAFCVRASNVCAQSRLSKLGTVKASLFWKRGQGAAAYLHLKRHARKQHVSASTQNRYFQNDIKSVGYFELKLHRHIMGTPETYITSCKKMHNSCSLRDLKYGHAKQGINMCFILINSQYVSNTHAYKQLVNNKNWSLK